MAAPPTTVRKPAPKVPRFQLNAPLAAVILPLLGALALTAAAVWFQSATLDPLPAADLAALDPSRNATALTLYTQALQLDNANPYRWADLGDALANSNQPARARAAFERALQLGPHLPAIRLRLVNFLILQDQTQSALPHAAAVLKSVPDYDAILFAFFTRSIDPVRVLTALHGAHRALRSWLQYTIAHDNPIAAALTWDDLLSQKQIPPDLAASYIDFLLRRLQLVQASAAWGSFIGPSRGDYPARNLIFNPTFASEPRPSPLDWHLNQDSTDFEVTREADSLKVVFQGKTNVQAEPAWQTVILPQPGAYRLSATVRTEGLTTNEGVRLSVQDLGLSSDSLKDSAPPTDVTLDFSVPIARTVRIAVIRLPSQKFDNKIAGTTWVSRWKLIPLSRLPPPSKP